MSQSYQNLNQANKGGSSYSSSSKNFQLQYKPENNRHNIYERKLQKQMPDQQHLFSDNPLTRILQPVDVTKSKRYVRDKLNISDIPGVKPDVYKKQRQLEGREYLNNTDIEGTQPSKLKQNKPMTGPDYKLYTKDINGDKWHSKRTVDPLQPQYEIPTRSGRKVRIGPIEKNAPKMNVSPMTRRVANQVNDIQGTNPKRTFAISEDQRKMVMSNEMQYNQGSRQSRNEQYNIVPQSNQKQNGLPIEQQELLKQQISFKGQPPNSHYARFQTYQQTVSSDYLTDKINQQNQYNQIAPLPSQLQSKQLFNNQQFHSQKQSLVNTQLMSMQNGINNNMTPDVNNQQKFVQPNNSGDSLNRFAGSNYIPLIQKPQSFANQIPLQPPQFVKSEPDIQTFHNFSNNSNNKSNESPQLQNRLWSKAQNVGAEIVSQQNDISRLSASKAYNIQNNLIAKNNFSQSIFQRGVQMNSGHNSSYINNKLGGGFNPINNEVNRSIDVNAQRQPYQELNYKQPSAYQQQSQSSIIATNSNFNSPLKNLVPPTTSKMYGNFLDEKKIDQMIKELRTNQAKVIPNQL